MIITFPKEIGTMRVRMTKKHFAKLAEAIATIKDRSDREYVAMIIGNVCSSLNEKFNWTIWNNACNL